MALWSKHDIEYINGVDEQGNPTYDTMRIKGNDNAASFSTTAATNKSNFALAQYQNLWNRQQLEDERAYNSPTAQRDRLLQAGYNPAFYDLEGNGNSSHLESADMANQQAPTLTPLSQSWNNLTGGLMNSVQSALAPLQLAVEKKKADATIENLNSSSAYNRENIKRIKTLMAVDEATAKNLSKQSDLAEANAKLAYERVHEVTQNVSESKAREMLHKASSDRINKLTPAELKQMSASTKLTDAQTKEVTQNIVNKMAQKVLLEGQTEAVRWDNFRKEIESEYIRLGKEQEFRQNNASIVETMYGKLTPMVNAIGSWFGGTEATAQAGSDGVIGNKSSMKDKYQNPSLQTEPDYVINR